MPIALQIRDVPDEVRDAIAKQALREGRSVQSYLLRLVEREARLLENAASFERTRGVRVSLPADADPVAIIREGREDGFEADRTEIG